MNRPSSLPLPNSRARVVTGWKLDPTDRASRLARFPALFPDVVADHVTLRSGTDASTPLRSERHGEIIGEFDDREGVQALVVRIGGSTIRADEGVFHITWSLDRARGRKAKESNNVIDRLGWRALAEPIPILLHPARF